MGIAGKDVKITSYINNLNPILHADLYSAIEKFIAKSIPLWDLTLTSTYGERLAPIPYYLTHDDYPKKTNRVLQRPELRDFEPYRPRRAIRVSLRERFRKRGLQVIVKLANIVLTPEKPKYGGGSWSVEGQPNESICATALYYYDSENIADNSLSFRHCTSEFRPWKRGGQVIKSPFRHRAAFWTSCKVIS